MPSERVQRHIDRLLDEADQGVAARDWAAVRDRAREVLALDPDNPDARELAAAAVRMLGDDGQPGNQPSGQGRPSTIEEDPSSVRPEALEGRMGIGQDESNQPEAGRGPPSKLPLPAGEGWGEGRPAAATPTSFASG